MKNKSRELLYCGYRDQCLISLSFVKLQINLKTRMVTVPSQGLKGDWIREGVTEMKRIE